MSSISGLYPALKKKIPLAFKRIPWLLFKSPQRETGFITIWIDFTGLVSLVIRSCYFILFKPELKSVSICTGLKNRSSNYIDIFLESLLKLDHPEHIELSVFDCGSDDIEDLKASIMKKWKGKLVFSAMNIEFSRSFAFNRAVEQSNGPLIFICDADISLPEKLVERCNRYVFAKNVWFPVCFYLHPGKNNSYNTEAGKWNPGGKGMFASKKSDFLKLGMFDESIKKWGGEDWDLWFRFYENGFFPYRNRQKWLFHHYHKSLKPDDFEPFKRKSH
jgi:glycosyltransferase involved in cell wall biosynthesis